MSQIQDDYIDLLDVIKQLWGGKWLITIFVFIFGFGASMFLYSQEPIYESKLSFSLENVPPFYKVEKFSTVSGETDRSSTKPVRDLEKLFYSEEIFERWKENYMSSTIVYKDLRLTKLIDGFVISKDKGGSLIIWTSEIDNYHILVRSRQLSLLNDLYNYLMHVNNILQFKYDSQAKNKLSRIEKHYSKMTAMQIKRDEMLQGHSPQEIQTISENILQDILSLEDYLSNSNKINGPFNIKHPTIPIKVSPKSSLVMILSIITGGLIGMLLVLLRNAVGSREK